MADINKVLLKGRLTRDPQLKYTPSGAAVCEFGLAATHKFKDKEDKLFVDCTAWGRTGEIANEYLTKGDPVLLEGRLKLDQWDDKSTGQKRSKISVTVEQLHLLGGSKGPRQDTSTRQSEPEESYTDGPDDEVPF
jgi:single-strand DNA-binding protein